MATLVLGTAGRIVGGLVGGPIGALIGGAIGAVAGNLIDQRLFGQRPEDQTVRGPRLKATDITASTEGTPIPRAYGRQRMAGQIIWQTRFEEEVVETTTTAGGGGKGGGGDDGVTTTTTEYRYYANFAVAFCEGPVARIGRIFADGREIDQERFVIRVHKGGSGQSPDALIEAKEDANAAPAYRGIAYVVFERLPLARWGNRIPVITAEVYRVVGRLEGLARGVALIPGSTEHGYDPEPVARQTGKKTKAAENRHALTAATDILASLDALGDLAPDVEAVSLVVAWFGDDLRVAHCTVRPKVESSTKATTPAWRVAGLYRADAAVVSTFEGKPAFGGSPSDASVVRAIAELKDRGYAVMLYPFIMMDVPAGNGLPDPYGGSEQSAYPWRGRITCSPAPGEPGTVDQTGTAAAQVADFVGTAAPGDFAGSAGTTASYSGPNEWSYRRFILHMATLARLGGADAFCIGSEMVGLTTVRSSATAFPFVSALRDLAGDVRSILGGGVKLGYAADWSEYHSHRPADGSGDVFFHLDPLWADSEIDFIGIDSYMPLADWRDGTGHLDYDPAGPAMIHDPAYLDGNVEGGELYDWYYASAAARDAQTRTPIVDADPAAEHWVFRQKDLKNWWLHSHHNRPGGVRSGSATAWTPEAKPIWFTELGCPAVDKGANQPNLFDDGKSSESGLPHYSSGARDDAMQRAYCEAVIDHWNDGAGNPVSGVYGGRMVRTDRTFLWCWDARPFPAYPRNRRAWADAPAWEHGHWLPGRFGAAPATETVKAILDDAGAPAGDRRVNPLPVVVDGALADKVMSARTMLDALQPVFAFDAAETGGRIEFTARAARGVRATLTVDDLAFASEAGSGGAAPRYVETRAQETELPAVVKLAYGEPAIDDQPGEVEARRFTVGSGRILELSPPVVAPASVVAAAAEFALHDLWAGREHLAFALPPSRLALDPGDVIDFGPIGAAYQLSEIAGGAARQIEARRFDRLFAAFAVPEREPPEPEPDETADAFAVFVDGPMLTDDDVEHSGHVGGYRYPFGHGIALYRSPAASGYQLARVLQVPAVIGELTAPLHSGPAWRWDRVNALYVAIYAGQLASAEELAVLNGANAAAVENADGEWEILQFTTATLNGAQNYILTNLLRGQRGSEHAMRNPVVAGAPIVFLAAGIRQTGIAAAEVGLALNWRVGPAELDVSSPEFGTEVVTMTGRGRRPYAPVRIVGERELPAGHWHLRWVRRTRIGGDNWSVVDVPLSEAAESYELEILNGPTVVRTVASLSAVAFVYTAAMQTVDFGSLQTSLAVRVYQTSALYGRGIAGAQAVYDLRRVA